MLAKFKSNYQPMKSSLLLSTNRGHHVYLMGLLIQLFAVRCTTPRMHCTWHDLQLASQCFGKAKLTITS